MHPALKATLFKGVGALNPATLFAGGYKGVWLDPSDLTTLFQDSAGTTPVTADSDPVGRVSDLSGNSQHATQATAGNRLVYRTGVLAARPGLEVTTAGRKLVTPSFLDSSFNTAFTCFAVVKSSGSATKVWAAGSGTNFYGGRTATGATANTTALSDTSISIAGPGTTYLQEMSYDGAKKVLSVYGADYLEEAATGNLTLSGALTVGDLAAGGFTWDGQVLGLLMINKALSVSEKTRLRAWYRARFDLDSVAAAPRVICDGNSLTAGVGASAPQTTSYPGQMVALLSGWNVVKEGVAGATTAERAAVATTVIDQLRGTRRTKDVAVLWEITNDLTLTPEVDPTNAIARYVAWCNGRRAAGLKVVSATVLPRINGGAGFEAQRQTVNAYLRANWAAFSDVLADVAADNRIGDPGDNLNTTYYDPDQIHLNDTGYGIVAGIVSAAILTL